MLGPALRKDNSRDVLGALEIGGEREEEPGEMELLGVLHHLKPVLRLRLQPTSHAKKHLAALEFLRQHVLARQLLLLGLGLVFSLLVCRKVIILALLNNCFGDDFGAGGICDGVFGHYFLVVRHLDLGQRCRRQSEAHSILLLLLFFEPLFSIELALFLVCEVDGCDYLVLFFDTLIL